MWTRVQSGISVYSQASETRYPKVTELICWTYPQFKPLNSNKIIPQELFLLCILTVDIKSFKSHFTDGTFREPTGSTGESLQVSPLQYNLNPTFPPLFRCLKSARNLCRDFMIYILLATEQPQCFTPPCALSAKRSLVSNIMKRFKC